MLWMGPVVLGAQHVLRCVDLPFVNQGQRRVRRRHILHLTQRKAAESTTSLNDTINDIQRCFHSPNTIRQTHVQV